MKKLFVVLIAINSTLLWVACNKDVGNIIKPDTGECKTTIVNQQAFDSAKVDAFEFVNVFINENCLFIKVQHAGGCGGSTFQLYGSGIVLESYPPATALKLGFINNDPCEAYLTETIQFDLAPLQALSDGEIALRIEGFETNLLYTY